MCSTACIISIVQVGLACNTANHHRLHEHEPRPSPPDDVKQTADERARSCQDVLVKNKERLNGPNLTPLVPQREKQI